LTAFYLRSNVVDVVYVVDVVDAVDDVDAVDVVIYFNKYQFAIVQLDIDKLQ
jgi:hypothetical protein